MEIFVILNMIFIGIVNFTIFLILFKYVLDIMRG